VMVPCKLIVRDSCGAGNAKNKEAGNEEK